MNSRSSFHGDSLFDQTNRLATQSLSQHQFPTFGHKMADTHQGIILHSGGQLPAIRGAHSLASRQHIIQVQHQMRIDNRLHTAKLQLSGKSVNAQLKTSTFTVTDIHNNPSVGQSLNSPKLRTSLIGPGPRILASNPISALGLQGHDYLVRKDGSINARASTNRFDRFYKEINARRIGQRIIRNYELVAVYVLADSDRNGNKQAYWARAR